MLGFFKIIFILRYTTYVNMWGEIPKILLHISRSTTEPPPPPVKISCLSDCRSRQQQQQLLADCFWPSITVAAKLLLAAAQAGRSYAGVNCRITAVVAFSLKGHLRQQIFLLLNSSFKRCFLCGLLWFLYKIFYSPP